MSPCSTRTRSNLPRQPPLPPSRLSPSFPVALARTCLACVEHSNAGVSSAVRVQCAARPVRVEHHAAAGRNAALAGAGGVRTPARTGAQHRGRTTVVARSVFGGQGGGRSNPTGQACPSPLTPLHTCSWEVSGEGGWWRRRRRRGGQVQVPRHPRVPANLAHPLSDPLTARASPPGARVARAAGRAAPEVGGHQSAPGLRVSSCSTATV